MKRQWVIGFVFVLLFSVLVFSMSPAWLGNVHAQRRRVTTINAVLLPQNVDVNVRLTMDGSPTDYDTPHTFYLNGTHTITVPNTDPDGHPFAAWSTGETTPTITVSYGRLFTAYYGVAPLPPTYNVTINTSFSGPGDVNVAITKDGILTGFKTPYTFNELVGTHNFTAPSTDPNGHPFVYWLDKWGSQILLNTITVWSGGTYTACYEQAFLCQFVTPLDPDIAAVAVNKSWVEVLDYVSSQINYGNETSWQLASETLVSGFGQCRDYSTLCVSMLRARGYTAYVAIGAVNSSGEPENHAWVIIDLNGTLAHLEPQSSWQEQRFVDFTVYTAEYYFNEKGVYPPSVSKNPRPLVTFTKSEHTTGAKWWIDLNGCNQSSSWDVIVFYAPNGTYAYSTGASDYVVSPSIGMVTVNGSDVEVEVQFTPLQIQILEQIVVPILVIVISVFIIILIVYKKRTATNKLLHNKAL